MTEMQAAAAGANPFSPRAALVLVLFGAAVFLALLWMIGAGMMTGPANDGGNHAAGKGLNGFAALSRLLEKQGYTVRRSRSELAFREPGLLVLTPPAGADANRINRIITRRRTRGPTLLVVPKWQAMTVPAALRNSSIKEGWVMLGGPGPVVWANDVQSVPPLNLRPGNAAGNWSGFGMAGRLPDPKTVQTMSSDQIIPLVRDSRGQVLAGYVDDGSNHPALAAAADGRPSRIGGSRLYPLVVVAEPDLIDNYGFARQENAMLALALIKATVDGQYMPIAFDLTLNGHARKANLLTLAFTPPFLAATLCLLLAALAIGWRAFLRFGPAKKPERAIAFGKRTLVANAAGLVRRTRRLHLLTIPYADAARERIVRALALPRQPDAATTDAAIDRALKSRSPAAAPFSQITARMRAARSRHEVVQAAQELHALERTLTQ